MDFYKECKHISLDDVRKKTEFINLPPALKKKASKMTHKELCKLLAVFKEANATEIKNLMNEMHLSAQLDSILLRPAMPSKYFKKIKPTYRFFHGRSVTRSANIWNSADSFKRVMWWAIDRLTPLMYASTSIKGRELDSSLRWDLYEASPKKEEKLLIISKDSIEWILANLGQTHCEGSTFGVWIKKAFPIVNGKLKRESYIATDRKMAKCLCDHIGAIGYIAPEIKVNNGLGYMHKEALFCNPAKHLKLTKFQVFTTKQSQSSVDAFLNGEITKLKPDIIKKF